MKNKVLHGIVFLLAVVTLTRLAASVLAIIIVEQSDTDPGAYTYAWAYVKGELDPQTGYYTNTWHDHYSYTPGTVGECEWWTQTSNNIRWWFGGHIVAAASRTRTYPWGQGYPDNPDADAYAEI
jgi:hypothetical protein